MSRQSKKGELPTGKREVKTNTPQGISGEDMSIFKKKIAFPQFLSGLIACWLDRRVMGPALKLEVGAHLET